MRSFETEFWILLPGASFLLSDRVQYPFSLAEEAGSRP